MPGRGGAAGTQRGGGQAGDPHPGLFGRCGGQRGGRGVEGVGQDQRRAAAVRPPAGPARRPQGDGELQAGDAQARYRPLHGLRQASPRRPTICGMRFQLYPVSCERLGRTKL